MMTVHQVSRLTGVTVRTLHFYDEKGLLKPAVTTDAGYRLYDDASLERLQQILLFRELEFPLSDIRRILDSPEFDRKKAIRQQIGLLELKMERIGGLLTLARQMEETGGKIMRFDAFDRKKIESYAEEAKKTWGGTDAWKEYEKRSAGRTDEKQASLADGLMDIFRQFGKILGTDPAGPEAQARVKALQDYITANYYTCTREILSGLGQMYAAGGEMTENIDRAGGEGTALFASKAIAAYCGK
ncbi:MAG: MerR family transcriptional regulator [Clostridiales bacterium]|nr:MerR family transcriptional regulator [Clostridiales bacterium]